jgi:hypothetical protein
MTWRKRKKKGKKKKKAKNQYHGKVERATHEQQINKQKQKRTNGWVGVDQSG